MNIFDIAEEFHISLAKLRKLEKRGLLRTDNSATAADPIRARLAKGNDPTALQLVELIENPGGLLELGKYAPIAERALSALGNPQSQVAPSEVVANIMEAAKNEPEAVSILIGWTKQILSHGKPVNHAYIATRLLLGVPASIRKFEAPRIPRALLNVRQHPGFASFWRVEKLASQNRTIYQKLALDL